MDNDPNVKDLPDDTRLPGHQYTLGEMRAMIRSMRDINSRFYSEVFHGGVPHAFIEFCGVQAEFINMCDRMLHEGIEFPLVNRHCETQFRVPDFQARYLGEKFGCIFKQLLPDEASRRVFIESAFSHE